jgi:hypothetical protein
MRLRPERLVDGQGAPIDGTPSERKRAPEQHAPSRLASVTTAHGTPLCQGAVEISVLGCVEVGPGSGLSEEPMSGVRSAALDCRVVPIALPGSPLLG